MDRQLPSDSSSLEPHSDGPGVEVEGLKQPLGNRGWRFWTIFGALCVTTMLSAVESSVTSTALPFIVHELKAGDLYVWFVNAFFLTSTACLPLLGQLANIFGRRWMMIAVVSVFALGSGISGGATNPAMMIAGRALQGLGGGGLNLLIELIVSDLVPLRERGGYIGIVFAIFALGTSIGPLVGGAIVQRTSWRWVFWINLPIAGAALVLHILFLRVTYNKAPFKQQMKRVDYAGNAILTAGVTAVLVALSWGGTKYDWSSYKVIVPLVLGVFGMVLFHAYEAMPWVKEPTLPGRIFTRRTPAAALVLAFLNFMILYWVIYFLPVYFQAVLGHSPIISGVALLPTALLSVLTAALSGFILTKTGRYKPLHIAAFAFMTLGVGLFARFDRHTSTAEWVLVQFVSSFGLGFIMSTNLSAVQADLAEVDVAAATAAFAFIRSYGSIWGVSIPAAIFNAEFAKQSWRIGNASVREMLSGGNAYSFATAKLVQSIAQPARDEVIDVYTRSLRLAWYVAIGFSLLGFLLSFLEKEIVLRTELETEFGLEDEKRTDKKSDQGPPSSSVIEA